MSAPICLLNLGDWVSNGKGRYFVDGKSGTFHEPVIRLVKDSAKGERLNVPLSEFGKTWHIVEPNLTPSPTLVGGFNG